MITPQTTLKEFLKYTLPKVPCAEALQYMLGLEMELPMDTTVENFVKDDKAPERYAYWVLMLCYKDLDDDMRRAFIGKVKDGSNAAKLIDLIGGITEESINQLKVIAHGGQV